MKEAVYDHAAARPTVRTRGALRSDWSLLPLLSFLTICVVLATTEWIARRSFRASKTTSVTCLVMTDPATGVRAIPNSVCRQKILEEPGATEYRFNSWGHRAGMEPLPKAPDTYRIVLVGSSIAIGLRVPRKQTFAALLPGEISRETGRKVEVYNEAMQWGTPHSVDLRFKEVMAAKPDLILWVVTPWDIENVAMTVPYPEAETGSGRPAGRTTIKQSIINEWAETVDSIDRRTRSLFLLRHMLYLSQSEYLKQFLRQGQGAAYLRAQPGAEWQSQLQQFGLYVANVTGRAKSAGVSVVATALPQRAQAAMISRGEWPAGFNPYQFGNQVRAEVDTNGGTYIDTLHGFRNVPNPERFYLAIDGHPTAGGHWVFAQLITKALTSGAVPELRPAGVAGTNSGYFRELESNK